MSEPTMPTQDVPEEQVVAVASGQEHSKREWMYLAERVFSHPRYALIILAALLLCVFERYWFVIAPLTLFFTIELVLRVWLQKEKGWRDRHEMVFLLFDTLATVGLYLILFVPAGLFANSMYLRLIRLLRGMYMLRMLRVFRFLTYETFVYSLPLALFAVGLSAAALGMSSGVLFVAVALMIELASRIVAVIKAVPKGKRRTAELCFAGVDFFATLALFDLLAAVPQWLVLLRLLRVLVMLDPLSSLVLAVKQVAQMHEVRKESGMLISVMLLLLLLSGTLIYFVYPQMDLSQDGVLNDADYSVMQVILFSFTWLIDPGTTPHQSFSPGLMLLTMVIAMTGVFFFALLVGLGTNVMAALLRELSNSPLSVRVQLLISGDNEKAQPVLKVFGDMCGRMRRSYYSVWVFFDKEDRVVSGFGNWLNIRQADAGSRDVLKHFKLSGIREMIFFHRRFTQPESMVDHHALVQEARLRDLDVGVSMFSQSGMSTQLDDMYRHTLGSENFNSASVTARMLYQMHHCSFMPELGIEMLDAIDGETGLFTTAWQAHIEPGGNGANVRVGLDQALLEIWATDLFGAGVNVLALRNEAGEFRLLTDLINTQHPFDVVDVVALGREPSLWTGVMQQMLKQSAVEVRDGVLKTFQWPDSWDLNMLFLGWHEGLPAMIIEMAEKHHKLTVNILNPSEASDIEHQQNRLDAACKQVDEAGQCQLQVAMHGWDGLDISQIVPLLRSCKVIMLYPTELADEAEDSLLELWYHALAGLLSKRKQEVKWWTPPKIMILPRNRTNSDTFIRSSESYPLLNIVVGSPDAFHDVYMARKMLSFAKRQADPTGYAQENKTFAFVNMLLGDAVLVESENPNKLLEKDDATWPEVYREGLRRGWVPLAFGLEPSSQNQRDLYRAIDRLFPIERITAGTQLHLLAGTLIDEFEMPSSTAVTLFCRRGVLLSEDEQEELVADQAEEKAEEKVEAQDKIAVASQSEACVATPIEEEGETAAEAVIEASAEQLTEPIEINVEEQIEAEVEEQNRELATAILEGEVMQEIWPKDADPRLLRVLTKQVEGALHLLNESTESGLMKIMAVLEKEAGTEVEGDIMDALTDLQNIDRVSQRLHNVRSCLDEWSQATKDQDSGNPTWKETVEQRYVMEEERLVLRDEL